MTDAPSNASPSDARAPYVLLDDSLAGQQRLYENPVDIITIYRPEDLPDAAARLERYHANGFYIAGYLAYEAGYALERRLKDLAPKKHSAPLLQFGVFKDVKISKPQPTSTPRAPLDLQLTPEWSEAEYLSRFAKVKDYIEAGDVYQINLCFALRGRFGGTARELYSGLAARQPVHYGAVISLSENTSQAPDIISLSPELFFTRKDNDMSMRPMKGTIARAADKQADALLRDSLKADSKSQAENLMIVDLLRNDLSRISKIGSVKVPELYALETYPTLHQMTSVVTSTLKDKVSFTQLFTALFPCGSVTGAPKIRAMEIISELESAPRGAYCGAIGYIDPDKTACFNVGIRTLILNGGELRYNVGSGVVMDSIGADEYSECLLKARLLSAALDSKSAPSGPAQDAQPSRLIETMRLNPDGSIPRLDFHLSRLSKSAQALRYPYSRRKVLNALQGLLLPKQSSKLRLTLARSGQIETDVSALTALPSALKLAISKNALTREVQETRHKVSARDFYDGERARIKALCGADEVIFLNRSGQICEGSFTTLFVKKGGSYITPDISCGLLPGTLRAQMMKDGAAAPAFLTPQDLEDAAIFMGNSLRGLMAAQLISPDLV